MNNELNTELEFLEANFLIKNKKMAEPYLVPNSYFSAVEEQLSFIPLQVQSGFQVPKNYFSEFETQLINKLNKEEKPPKRRTLNSTWIRPFTTIAASLLLIFGFIYLKQKQESLTSNDWTEQQLEILFSEYSEEDFDWVMSPASYVYDGIEKELFPQLDADLNLLDPIFEPVEDAQDNYDSIYQSI